MALSYYFTKAVPMPFDETLRRVTEELKREGFGILTEIDVRETLKKKLGVEFRRYKILGTCNPPLAYQALQTEDRIGLLLPCNVIVQERGERESEVSGINPLESMKSVQNSALEPIGRQVAAKLKSVIDRM